MAFRVMSNAFSYGAPLPARYARDGANESPLIFWDEAPEGTQSLALIMFDRSTEPTSNHYHWLVYDIPAKEPLLSAALPRLAELDDGVKQGLNDFRDRHPPVLPVFFAFRVMVGMGLAMLAASWVGAWLYWRSGWQAERLPRALLWLLAGMTFAGWVATLAGWYVTEIGRQPVIVFGLVRTADVASKISAPMIGLTLALYLVLYFALVLAYVGVLKYMAEKPEEVLDAEAAEQAVTPPGAIGAAPLPGGGATQ